MTPPPPASGSGVLVLAQRGDTEADRVVTALHARGVRVARLDTADFPGAAALSARPDLPGGRDWLMADGRRVELGSIRSVYRRHPARFEFPESMSGPERQFATLESVAGWGGVLAAQRWLWLDSPAAAADSAYKPRQLRVAVECGLRAPRSLVTNVAAEVRAFAAEVGGPLVYKSLASGLVLENDQLKIVYTTVIEPDELDDLDAAAIGLSCHLFQEWVPKAHDVRLTAVGHRLFPVAVHAHSARARIDWRCAYDDLTYQPCAVPADVRTGVTAYLARFGLRFAAFDFSVTADGRWWFLEAGASGRWEWIEDETGVPITAAIADELIELAGSA